MTAANLSLGSPKNLLPVYLGPESNYGLNLREFSVCARVAPLLTIANPSM